MRTLSPANLAQLVSGSFKPVFFIQLTFLTGTAYACTAPFPISWGGNTWLGVGDVGKVGAVSESTEIVANGLSVTLSGIDNALLLDSLNDIGALLPAAIYLGFWSDSGLVDTPIKTWGGVVDAPTISVGPDASTITLALETRLLNLQRGTQRRWTAEDQHRLYPDDTAFGWIPQLENLSLRWG